MTYLWRRFSFLKRRLKLLNFYFSHNHKWALYLQHVFASSYLICEYCVDDLTHFWCTRMYSNGVLNVFFVVRRGTIKRPFIKHNLCDIECLYRSWSDEVCCMSFLLSELTIFRVFLVSSQILTEDFGKKAEILVYVLVMWGKCPFLLSHSTEWRKNKKNYDHIFIYIFWLILFVSLFGVWVGIWIWLL